MVNIAIIILIPVIALMVGFFTLYGVYLGLKWQVEVKQEQTPTQPFSNPIQPILEQKREEKAEETLNEVLDEYLNGPKEG